MTLPAWRPAGTDGGLPPRAAARLGAAGRDTPTVVISTALATRDFQDVHHDRDAAVQRGGKDIFVNILTTTGLVQRYVTDWAGPSAVAGRHRDPAGCAVLPGRHADLHRLGARRRGRGQRPDGGGRARFRHGPGGVVIARGTAITRGTAIAWGAAIVWGVAIVRGVAIVGVGGGRVAS